MHRRRGSGACQPPRGYGLRTAYATSTAGQRPPPARPEEKPDERAATSRAEPLQQQLPDPPGVRGPSGRAHDRADERAEGTLVAGADLLGGVRVGGDGGVDRGDELVLPGDLPAVLVDDPIHIT